MVWFVTLCGLYSRLHLHLFNCNLLDVLVDVAGKDVDHVCLGFHVESLLVLYLGQRGIKGCLTRSLLLFLSDWVGRLLWLVFLIVVLILFFRIRRLSVLLGEQSQLRIGKSREVKFLHNLIAGVCFDKWITVAHNSKRFRSLHKLKDFTSFIVMHWNELNVTCIFFEWFKQITTLLRLSVRKFILVLKCDKLTACWVGASQHTCRVAEIQTCVVVKELMQATHRSHGSARQHLLVSVAFVSVAVLLVLACDTVSKSLGWVSLLEWTSRIVATLTVGVVIWLATTLSHPCVIQLGSRTGPNCTKTCASFLILGFFCEQIYLRPEWTFAIVTGQTLSAEVTLLTSLKLNYEVLLQWFVVWQIIIGRKVIVTTFGSRSDVVMTVLTLRHHKSSIRFQRRWNQIFPNKTKFFFVFLIFFDFFIQLVYH